MATDNLKFIPNIALATHLFTEIATSAIEIDQLYAHTGRSDDVEELAAYGRIVRTLIKRIGWMADLGNKKLNEREEVQGDAEQWLMHPAYIDELGKANVA